MKKVFVYTLGLFLSAILLIGCGHSNNQISNQSNVASNNPVKTNDYQAKTYNGWTTIKIEDEVEFQIPPTMEIQSGEYQAAIQKRNPNFYQIVTQGGNLQRIVAQQKGLNEKEKSAYKQYARAVIKIGREAGDVYPKWGDEIPLSEKDLKEMESDFIDGTISNSKGKLIGISQHLKIVKVNGINCLNMKYETQLDNNPIVNNDMYMFFNKNKLYQVLTMIRSTEYEYWTSKDADMRNIVNTFKPCK